LKPLRAALLLPCLLLPLAAAAKIDFQDGPLGDIGGLAQVKVPKGWKFVPAGSCKEFLGQTGNLASGQEKGVLIEAERQDGMWVIFEWQGIGNVAGAGKERLDADSLWAQLQEGAKQSNAEREQRGWDPVDLLGWGAKPEYDPQAQRLGWSLRLSSKGRQFANMHARLLGRRGVMKVVLAAEDGQQARQMARLKQVLAGFSFKPGSRYSDWRPGDKAAPGGLAALILGRPPAKSGLFGGLGLALASCGVLGLGYWGLKRKHRAARSGPA
jgi:uncharacterized membrane-anchored protein